MRISANPQYAFVRLKNGKETTVSLRQLAPVGEVRDNNRPEESNNPTSAEQRPLAAPEELVMMEEAGPPLEEAGELTELGQDLTEPGGRSTPVEAEERRPFIRTRHYVLRSGKK